VTAIRFGLLLLLRHDASVSNNSLANQPQVNPTINTITKSVQSNHRLHNHLHNQTSPPPPPQPNITTTTKPQHQTSPHLTKKQKQKLKNVHHKSPRHPTNILLRLPPLPKFHLRLQRHPPPPQQPSTKTSPTPNPRPPLRGELPGRYRRGAGRMVEDIADHGEGSDDFAAAAGARV